MHNFVIVLGFIVIFHPLSTTESVVNLEDDTFDLILADWSGKVGKVSSNARQTTTIQKFNDLVPSLARYKDYLFISQYNTEYRDDSNVYRCGFDWDKLILTSPCVIDFNNKTDWVIYDYMIRSMVAAKNYLFVGLDDGRMWRCPADVPGGNCEVFYNNRTWDYITGMDYDSRNEKTYATTQYGTLLRCSPDTVDSCEAFYSGGGMLDNVHVAHDAVWLGTRNGQLLKCPLSGERFKCQEHDKFFTPSIISFDHRKEFLYVLVAWDQMYRCDPNVPKSCSKVFSTPDHSLTFLIAN